MKTIAICVLCLLLSGCATTSKPKSASQGSAPETMPKTLPISWDQPIKFQLVSSAVHWRSNTFHLLQLGKIEFHLEKESGALTAKLSGGTGSFDNVDYDVSVAVFGRDEALLGVARTQIPIQRIWLGIMGAMSAKADLDFGTSLDYERAASFKVAISRKKVLTPDQWQK